MKLKQAKKLAKKYSKDLAIRHAGVTKFSGEYFVVTTWQCVKYQLKGNSLLFLYSYGRKRKNFIL